MENDELSPQQAASKSPMVSSHADVDTTSNNNNNCNFDFSQSREEGELSSYDDDDYHGIGSSPQVTSGQTAHSLPSTSGNAAPVDPVQGALSPPSTSANAAPVELVQSDLTTKSAQNIKAGQPVSSSQFVKSVPSRHNQRTHLQKNYERNRAPFVISFSDDDSGSDSEDSGRQHTAKGRRDLGADRTKRPLATSLPKPQKVQPRTEAKMLTGKVALGHTVAPSVTQNKGVTPWSGGPHAGSRASNSFKRVDGQDHVRKTNFLLDSRKLQDLRQLIAKREHELKRKSAEKSKTSCSALHTDNRFTTFSNDKRLRRAASVDGVECEAKEPDKKRLKTSEFKLTWPSAEHREVPEKPSMFISGESVLQNFNKQKADDIGKEMPSEAAHLSLDASQKQGTDTVINNKQISRNSKVGDVLTSSEQPEQTANDPVKIVSRKTRTMDLKRRGKRNNQHPSSILQSHAVSENYGTEESDHHQIQSNEKVLNPTSNDMYQGGSHHLSDSNPRISDVSLYNPHFWNSIRMGNSDMDIQALLDLEVTHDKALEEAQKHRRNCEIEERDALETYRKAQRALAEANSRCCYLYRKREMFSAQLRSLMMENSNLFCSLGANDQYQPQLNPLNNFLNNNAHLIPGPSGHYQADHDAYDQQTFDPNVNIDKKSQGGDVSGHDPVSDPYGGHDNSASEPHNADGVYCPSEDSSMSEDENRETYDVPEHGLERERDEQSSGESLRAINHGSDAQDHAENFQDSLLLEASLRSRLFERLRMNALTKKSDMSQAEPLDEETRNDDCGRKGELISEQMLLSSEVEDQHFDLSGCQQRNFVHLLSPILRGSFCRLKILEPSSFFHLHSGSRSPEIQTVDDDDENDNSHPHSEIQPSNSGWTSVQAALMDLHVGNVGTYSSSLPIDPFWPLCMYELRGKCNNDECAWQHARNYSCNDSQVSSAKETFDSAATLTKSNECLLLSPPIYFVDLDVLQADMCSNKSFLTGVCGQCWKKCFSSTLVLSSQLPTDFSLDEPFLHGSEPRIESHASWNRQLLYFYSRNGLVKQGDEPLIDSDQALERALLNLYYEANKQKGRLEALQVLARAVEADPTSAVLWIVYLQIYYSNQKSTGKDDMFQYAVEQNGSSYVLWLLYINSRTNLDDRLAAYNAALLALCRNVSGSVSSAMHASESILDIFLQMMNCLSMSGNVGKVVEIIHGICSSSKSSDKLSQLLLPDMITYLTINDKCVFWLSCIYLAIYRKIPDAITQRFEFRKELSAIEWPATQLTVEGKQRATSLLGVAVNSLGSYIDGESLENEETLKAAHLFSVNHVKCVAVLEGFKCSRNLLEKYTKLYPSCLELVLMSAWTETDKFVGFERALINWSRDVPGIQCLWNQYVECALQSEKLDFVKGLMERWFRTVWKVQCSQSGTAVTTDDENARIPLQSSSASDPPASSSISVRNDTVFGLLNLALYKVLHDDHSGAHSALDRALKVASAETYGHCVREHAVLSLAASLQLNSEGHTRTITKILNGYLVDARASHGFEPLTRYYVQKIKKPRVQQLVTKLLHPLSNYSLMNSVLEVWYGPTLLPQTYEKLTDLVDFVEAVMGILPSNYQLAISVCKFLIQRSETAKVPANVSFWASSLLVNALIQAVPVAPESEWLESADVLRKLTELRAVCESFHKRALVVHPLSLKLWKSYLSLYNDTEDGNAIREAARGKGIFLD